MFSLMIGAGRARLLICSLHLEQSVASMKTHIFSWEHDSAFALVADVKTLIFDLMKIRICQRLKILRTFHLKMHKWRQDYSRKRRLI